jgi:hypothetical protein
MAVVKHNNATKPLTLYNKLAIAIPSKIAETANGNVLRRIALIHVFKVLIFFAILAWSFQVFAILFKKSVYSISNMNIIRAQFTVRFN